MSTERQQSFYGLQCCLYLIVACCMLLFDKHSKDTIFLRRLLSSVVAPMQYVANSPVHLMSDLHYYFISRKKLLAENQRLENALVEANTQNQFSQSLHEENRRLRELLIAPIKENAKTFTADILRVSHDPFLQQVIIGVAKRDKLEVGQAVVDSAGIYGQIVAVNNYVATVMQLSDSRHAVPVVISRTGFKTVVVGNGPKQSLSLMYVSKTTDVKPGDVLIASGAASRFPADYPVGEVLSVDERQGQRFLQVSVKPYADLEHDRQVIVIEPQRGEL